MDERFELGEQQSRDVARPDVVGLRQPLCPACQQFDHVEAPLADVVIPDARFDRRLDRVVVGFGALFPQEVPDVRQALARLRKALSLDQPEAARKLPGVRGQDGVEDVSVRMVLGFHVVGIERRVLKHADPFAGRQFLVDLRTHVRIDGPAGLVDMRVVASRGQCQKLRQQPEVGKESGQHTGLF